MKKFLLLFALTGFIFMSCDPEEEDMMTTDEYKVDITIDSPFADAVVSMNDPMGVKVTFARDVDQTIHHVKIVVLDSDNNIVETILEDHAHVSESYVYDEATAYTPTTAGTFKLKAMSHDMEDNHATPAEITFTVN